MRCIAMLGVLVVVGCSSPGGGPDARSNDPPSHRKRLASVEVVVYTNVANTPPVSGVLVAFVDPDGYGEIVVTGADGIARGQVVVGGSVTALTPLTPDNPPYLTTVLGVQNGDHIALGAPSLIQPDPPTNTPTCTEATVDATYKHVDPTRVSRIFVQRTIYGGNSVVNGSALTVDPTTNISVTGAGAARAYMNTSIQGPNPGDQQQVFEAIDGCATSYQLDVKHNLLPWVGVPSLDAEQGIVHIPMDGEGGGDFLDVYISYHHDGDAVNWRIASPHAGDVYLPPLPGELASLQPVVGDALSIASAMIVDDAWVHGYDHAREKAFVRTFEPVERLRTSYRAMLF